MMISGAAGISASPEMVVSCDVICWSCVPSDVQLGLVAAQYWFYGNSYSLNTNSQLANTAAMIASNTTLQHAAGKLH